MMAPIPLPAFIADDLVSLILGEQLGQGIARTVFALGPWPDQYVVKLEMEDFDFQNIAEWELWQSATSALRPWLAPCVAISRGGKALLQMRCEPCPRHLIPTKAPKVLGDLHSANWGLYEGHPVVQDYGRHMALAMTANAKAMRKVA